MDINFSSSNFSVSYYHSQAIPQIVLINSTKTFMVLSITITSLTFSDIQVVLKDSFPEHTDITTIPIQNLDKLCMEKIPSCPEKFFLCQPSHPGMFQHLEIWGSKQLTKCKFFYSLLLVYHFVPLCSGRKVHCSFY